MSWHTVNRNLIAKAISELYFEEVFAEAIHEINAGSYKLNINPSLAYYFKATESIWSHLMINAASLTRSDHKELDAATFFKETQHLTKMSDITLAHFIEEMQSTLYNDQIILQRQAPVDILYQLDAIDMESRLNGHPKLLLNKGRLGWAPDDLAAYAPERNQAVQLTRIAIKKDLLNIHCQHGTDIETIIQSGLSQQALKNLQNILNNKTNNNDSYYILPTHPWQWKHKIRLAFQQDIQQRNIIFLSDTGNHYKPHISIRTFSNLDNPTNFDIKLPITILNTSCYRGISPHYISIAAELSSGIASIIKQDPLLSDTNTDCLKDVAAYSYISPDFRGIPSAPYRYQELLGGIWRESAQSKLAEHETCLMTGALAYRDASGKSLIGHLIEQSTLTTAEWLKHYFKKTIIPLLHLQSHYGIGLVAHGQNTLLKLKNHIPSGLLIKDFQGDLRLSAQLPKQTKKHFSQKVIQTLDTLPPEHIVYDLITGHFVSVLRFMSEALFLSHGYTEEDFYQILAIVIANYEQNHPAKSGIPSLLSTYYHRVLLNKVRFEIGYQDTAQRPKPQLGSPLLNPLNIRGCNDVQQCI